MTITSLVNVGRELLAPPALPPLFFFSSSSLNDDYEVCSIDEPILVMETLKVLP
jgi:hypothetical protein